MASNQIWLLKYVIGAFGVCAHIRTDAASPFIRHKALESAERLAKNGWRVWVEHKETGERIYESEMEKLYNSGEMQRRQHGKLYLQEHQKKLLEIADLLDLPSTPPVRDAYWRGLSQGALEGLEQLHSEHYEQQPLQVAFNVGNHIGNAIHEKLHNS